MARRVSSRRFVGRESQLAELERVLGEAAAGRGWLALVAGESGVGKTRLVDEHAARARAAGARVLMGDCVELAEGELPYAPLIGALRPLTRAGDPALDAVRAELALPEGEQRAAQGRFFELLLDALDRLAGEAPLVLVLEDIHWADRSTRDFIAFAARNLGRERVVLVATYRTDELHRRHPLRPLLPELLRLERTTLIEVERLTRDEVALLLADILGGEPDAALVDRLYRRCEGNPLFAEELIAAGPGGRAELPPTLRDALMVRVEGLAEPTQDVLRAMAAAARADEALLADVTGLRPEALRPALREAIAHHVLVGGDDGRYAFRHALLREAMHDDLLPGEHVELHLKLARALERRAEAGEDDLDTVTAIAHHFAVAGEQPEALRASVRAADAAERTLAPAETAAQLERALSLWSHVPDAEAWAGCDHPRLLERLAAAALALGEFDRSGHALETALGEVDADADPKRAARLLERRGKALWESARGEEAMASYERGLALLASDPAPNVARALLLAAKAKTLMLQGRYAETAALCERTLEEAGAVGARSPQANALNTLGVALAGLGDLAGGIARLEESMAIDRADRRLENLDRGYVNLSDVLFLNGRTREGRDLIVQGVRENERRGMRAAWMRVQAAEMSLALGDLRGADEWLRFERASSYSGALGGYYRMVSAELALARGDPEGALRCLEVAREMAAGALDPQWHAPLSALTAQALRRLRRFEEAREAIADGRARLAMISGMQDSTRAARLAAAEVALEADVAERGRDLGDAAATDEALARAHDARERARAETVGAEARGWVAYADAQMTRALGEAAPVAWSACAQAWESAERLLAAVDARWREAEALVRAGDRAAAEAVASAAHAAAKEMEASWLVGELESLARRARLRLGGVSAGGDGAEPGGGEPDAALGLTPREREVLALLAAGATNREIGEALFMAEKTASVHVSRILAKLGVRSRTEAAAVAHRLGLVSEPAR